MQPQQNRNSENPDPTEQNNPVPRVVMGLALALALWGVGYIFMAEPDGVAELGDRRVPAALAPSAAQSQGKVDGKQVYAANCQACHQATGQGLPGVFPPLANSSWVKGEPQVLTQIILHGLTGPIEVAGITYNGAMPAFGAQLGDAEIAAVATFIRNEWGNGSAAVEAASVTATRQASDRRSAPWQDVKELQEFIAAQAESKS
ncbi:c-type cytochrome [Noviherbaspirillum sedimenti]|uniref:Cytochrome c n=1 Tax=Noviherbaspirillum sedimenti TaxID=2320865 RepID=A0A3A3GPI5_9BURK|nr:cytochrome c [Noviherbaspirillum sedimenti]RJG04236.1 cytochrome c [Noviherbaspirillum sedimenti]